MWAALLRLLAMNFIAKKTLNNENTDEHDVHKEKTTLQKAIPYAVIGGIVILGTVAISSMIDNKEV